LLAGFSAPKNNSRRFAAIPFSAIILFGFGFFHRQLCVPLAQSLCVGDQDDRLQEGFFSILSAG
jgi:hypothetical protein